MKSLNRQFFKTLGLSWLSFLVVGVLISILLPTPDFTVLIDRSYCPSSQWQQVVQQYQHLYRQHQRKQVRIKTVVLFSDLGEEVMSSPPSPEDLYAMNTYGRSNPHHQQRLQTAYPNAQLLHCLSTPM